MENGILKAVSAMTDIDDSLILEAAEHKKQNKSINKRAVFKYSAAAAAALLLTAGVVLGISRFNKNGGFKWAMEPPGEAAPSETEPAPRPEASDTALLPAHDTPDPTSAPGDPTDAPASPTLEATPDTTAEPTPQATGTQAASPSATTSEGSGGQPQPTGAPMPTEAPDPTSDATSPPAMPELSFASLEEFIAAVRSGSDTLLDGIDRYYTPDGFPADRTWLAEIKVDMDTVTYRYYLAGGAEFKLVWFRSEGYSQRLYKDLLENNPDGNMHGSLFVFLTQAGYYIGARLDDGHLLRMHASAHFSEEEMVDYCAFARHGI